MDLLKLVAFDRDDMEVVSAHLQDAVVKVGDVHWRANEQRLVVGLSRFDWEAALAPEPQYRRRLAALRFDRVLGCKCNGKVKPQDKEEVLNLLAVEFSETDSPAGMVRLLFSGGGELRLNVECLEAELADLGPVWTAAKCPQHLAELPPSGVDASQSPGH